MSEQITFSPAAVRSVLASGLYVRAHGELLTRRDRRCCIGVMCDLAGIDRAEVWGRSMLDRLPDKDRERFYAMFPWVRDNAPPVFTVRGRSGLPVETVLMNANDSMAVDAITYDEPIYVLDQLIGEE